MTKADDIRAGLKDARQICTVAEAMATHILGKADRLRQDCVQQLVEMEAIGEADQLRQACLRQLAKVDAITAEVQTSQTLLQGLLEDTTRDTENLLREVEQLEAEKAALEDVIRGSGAIDR
jgi:hypothetical protein